MLLLVVVLVLLLSLVGIIAGGGRGPGGGYGPGAAAGRDPLHAPGKGNRTTRQKNYSISKIR